MGLSDDVRTLDWYHSIDLPGGVTTPGHFDTRKAVPHLPFPESLSGRRCLDVGTCDGFWAFEMERLGAGEVVGIDVDDPSERDYPVTFAGGVGDAGRAKSTFGLAKETLGSKAERVPLNVYDLSEDRLGRFDYAFVGAILLHLRDPVRALSRVREVADEVLVGDVIWLTGTRLFPNRPVAMLDGLRTSRWWTANLAGLRRFVASAGFEVIGSGGPFYVPFGEGHPDPRRTRKRAPLTARVAKRAIDRVGVPHAWVRGRAPRSVA
jgi:tRNA (mo5U34)-methyltransferase